MDEVLAGWHVLQLHAAYVLVVAAYVAIGGALVLALMPAAFTRNLSGADCISLVSAVWVFPALIFGVLALVLTRLFGGEWPVRLLAALAVLAVIGLAGNAARSRGAALRPRVIEAGVVLLALFCLVFLRFVFIEGLLLPQYFDSATHYGLIQGLMHWAQGAPSRQGIALPLAPYYHLGYHALLAGLMSITRRPLGPLMLTSGQIILALIPFALFALAHRLTGSLSAAWIAVAFAAAGWDMPAFAANWGKYPALLGWLPALGALTLGLLALERTEGGGSRRMPWMLSLALASTAVLIQTRYVLVLAAATFSFAASLVLWKLGTAKRRAIVALVLAALLLLLVTAWREPALRPTLEPYVGSGLWATIAAGLLGAAAIAYRPRQALGICMFLACLLAGLNLAAPWAGIGSVLDRPLVEMLLFAPLSILGSLGFAALSPRLGATGGKVAAVILAGALIAHAAAAYDMKASACCTIFTQDDAVAIDWLETNAAPEEAVAIATEHLQLGRGGSDLLIAPVDAGAWIAPLSGLATVALDGGSDFADPAMLESLCVQGVRFIYVGGSGRGFDLGVLQSQRGTFATRLQLPRATVMETVGCGE